MAGCWLRGSISAVSLGGATKELLGPLGRGHPPFSIYYLIHTTGITRYYQLLSIPPAAYRPVFRSPGWQMALGNRALIFHDDHPASNYCPLDLIQ